MQIALEILIAAFLVVGGVFGFVGSYGLIKLEDALQRLHGPTKATTLGVGGVLVASMIWFTAFGGGLSFHELLITLFLFLTAPITANFIAKTWMALNLRAEDLPPSGAPTGWSLYDDPPGGSSGD